MFAFLAAGWEILIVVLVGSIILIASIEHDRDGPAVLSLIVGAAAVFFLTHTNPWVWLLAHKGAVLWSAVGYFIAGLIWAFWKWYLYALDLRDQIKEVGGLELWKAAQRFAPRDSVPLAVADHKSRITRWMTYWPWSFVWWILHSPVKRAWQFIYARTATTFQAISDRVFRDVLKEPPRRGTIDN